MPKSKYDSGKMMEELRKGAAEKSYGQKAAPKPKPDMAKAKEDGSSDENPDPKKAEEMKKKTDERMKNLASGRKKQFLPKKD
jgi:hypothetical protein